MWESRIWEGAIVEGWGKEADRINVDEGAICKFGNIVGGRVRGLELVYETWRLIEVRRCGEMETEGGSLGVRDYETC